MSSKPHYTLGFYPLTSPDYTPRYWRWWTQHFNPKTYWKTIKYFCQRGYRGYADCDSWDANSYLEAVILGLLTRLQQDKRGYPANLCTCTKDESGFNCKDSDNCDGAAIWASILQEIIDGLKANRELQLEETCPDAAYPHLGEPIEWERVKVNGDNWDKVKTSEDLYTMKELSDGKPRFNEKVWNAWAKPLQKKQKRAMVLLFKHWGSFWD